MYTIRALAAALLVAGPSTAATAHTAVMPHDHPHGLSPILGLETLGVAAAFVAIGLAVYGLRRRAAAKAGKDR